MMTKEKTVVLTCKQAAEIVDIIRTIEKVAKQQKDKAEQKLMAKLKRIILRGEISTMHVRFTTTMENLFAMYLAVDTYMTFLTETNRMDERPFYEDLGLAFR